MLAAESYDKYSAFQPNHNKQKQHSVSWNLWNECVNLELDSCELTTFPLHALTSVMFPKTFEKIYYRI